MDIRSFGTELLRTRDLDPVYVGLAGANLPRDQLARLLLAYWCFYHLGAAAYVSEFEGAEFWATMLQAAENAAEPQSLDPSLPAGRWPRASERRHFRGQKCVDAVDWLRRSEARPEAFVEFLAAARTERLVMSLVQGWPMFGPWIAFKAADMMERVWGADISFSPNVGLMYSEPAAALTMLTANPGFVTVLRTPRAIYEALLVYFSAQLAPPVDVRPRSAGPQEVETILCKWKSHMGGHYHVGKDIAEQRAGLAGWGETAGRILAAYPAEVKHA